MNDVLIVGGGVIGLSIAYELSRLGAAVRVVEQGELGRQASWAGAGILPPHRFPTTNGERQPFVFTLENFRHHRWPECRSLDPMDQLKAISFQLFDELSSELLSVTGIDNGFRKCGGLQLALSAGESATLAANRMQWEEEGISVEHYVLSSLTQDYPSLRPLLESSPHPVAWYLADECQVRNPWHLRALKTACERNGVQFSCECKVKSLVTAGERIVTIESTQGPLSADHYCFATGAWSQYWGSVDTERASVFPMRGQILQYELMEPPFPFIITVGSRYIVPRPDGVVLVGSTEEEVGFDCGTTESVARELQSFATRITSALPERLRVRQWAGLRPASFDGMPYLGRIRQFANGFIATGHFRNGLLLAPATGILMSRLIAERESPMDLGPFSLDRY